MILTELKIHNFKSLKNVSVTFGQCKGIIGVIGDNGVGKSSFLQAIQFLLTGSTHRSKADLLRRGAYSGYVEGSFEHNGKEGQIRRSIESQQLMLKWDGKKCTKAGEIKELWSQMFNIDSAIFANIIMCRQGDAQSLVYGDTMSKAKLFQKLFRVPNLESIRLKLWKDYINKLELEREPVGNFEELNKRLQELQQEKQQHEQRRMELESQLLDKENEQRVDEWLIYFESCAQIQQEVAALQNEHNVHNQQVAQLTENLRQFATVDDLQELELEQKLKQVQELEFQFNDWLKKSKIAEARKKLQVTPEELIQLEQQHQHWQAQTRELRSQLSLSRIQADALKKQLDNLDNDVDSHCPVCRQEIKDKANYILTLKQQQNQREEECRQLQQQWVDADTTSKRTTQRYEDAKRAGQELQVVPERPDFDPAQLAQLTLQLKQIREMKQARLVLQTQLKTAQEQLQRTHVKMQNLPICEAGWNEQMPVYQQLKQKNDLLKEDCRQLDQALGSVNDRLKLTEELLQSTQQAQNRNIQLNHAIQVLREVYDVFYYDNFPLKLLKEYATEVEAHLIAQLNYFNIPYQVTMNESFEITVRDDAGEIIPEVSGGQGVIIGLCLRLALHEMFCNSFPMLIIDEGTTHLDSNNVRLYIDMLKQLKNSGKFNQVFIVDHNNTIKEVMDELVPIDLFHGSPPA